MQQESKTATELIDIYKSYNYKIIKNISKETILEKKYGGTEQHRRFVRMIFIDKVLNTMKTSIDMRDIPNRPIPAVYKGVIRKQYQLKKDDLLSTDSSKKVLYKHK